MEHASYKATGLNNKQTNAPALAVMQHAFLYISFPSLHNGDLKASNFTLCGEDKRQDDFLFFFLLNVDHTILKNSTLGTFANIMTD